jgi:hypothetical protein
MTDVRARRWTPLVGAACGVIAVLVIAMTTRVNIGIRHVLPIYAVLASVAAAGAMALWRQRPVGRIAAGVALVWSLVVPMRSYPDHIAYFNAVAGDHPERILTDSNIDWGQDPRGSSR